MKLRSNDGRTPEAAALLAELEALMPSPKLGPLPDYLAGTFSEEDAGFRLFAEADFDWRASAALNDENPWRVLCALLLRAREEDFSELSRLIALQKKVSDLWFWHCSSVLLGAAAPKELLELAIEEHRAKKSARIFDFQSAMLLQSGQLWAVPIVLDWYLADAENLSALPLLLSRFLEREEGVIAQGISANLAGADYRQKVMSAFLKLEAELSHDALVFRGEAFDLLSIAEDLLTMLQEQTSDEELLFLTRMIFEAASGVDCRAFLSNAGDIQFLEASLVVEDFLESHESERFEKGRRYFCGHLLET